MEDDDKIVWEKAYKLSDRFKMQPAQPPKIDAKVSKLVGKNVFINDPRLVKLVMKWKRTHSPDEVMNYLDHEVYRKELIAAFK